MSELFSYDQTQVSIDLIKLKSTQLEVEGGISSEWGSRPNQVDLGGGCLSLIKLRSTPLEVEGGGGTSSEWGDRLKQLSLRGSVLALSSWGLSQFFVACLSLPAVSEVSVCTRIKLAGLTGGVEEVRSWSWAIFAQSWQAVNEDPGCSKLKQLDLQGEISVLGNFC